jgi:hypothetical protein
MLGSSSGIVTDRPPRFIAAFATGTSDFAFVGARVRFGGIALGFYTHPGKKKNRDFFFPRKISNMNHFKNTASHAQALRIQTLLERSYPIMSTVGHFLTH